MVRFFAIFMLPVLVFGRLEMGIERLSMDYNRTPHLLRNRTFYAGTNVTVTVSCTSVENIEGYFQVTSLLCENSTSEETKVYHKVEACTTITNIDFTINSSYFRETGIYKLNFIFNTTNRIKNVIIRYGTKMNFLSPKDYPLFVFYSVMCMVYAMYALVWLVLCCCHWRELLRIQFWIGGVILLGMLEKAMFVGEYDAVRRNGETTGSMLVAAEVVSSLKRTLSRMLVIIVSLGFGIVKPRLGAALHKVTLVGIIFFVVSCADGVVRSTDVSDDDDIINLKQGYSERVVDILRFLLSIIDAVILLWIFHSIVKTISLLTVRKNLVKLLLYRHFRNVLIFSVLASVVFMVGFYIKDHYFNQDCPWERILDEEWWEEAFWSLLFSIILIAIIVLWRPSANNRRYAYSPLHDVDDDEVDQLTECTNEGLGVSKRGNDNGENLKRSTNNEDDDLKWVEDNIPKSIIDSALSNLVESDEEINQKSLRFPRCFDIF